MATSFQSHVYHSFKPPYDSCTHAAKVPGLSWEGAAGDEGAYSHSLPAAPWKTLQIGGGPNAALADLVRSLQPRNSNGMALSKIIGADHERLLEWIRSERMRKLPAEGSSYDKVLICGRLFVERVHHFDRAIRHFAQESHMATQLAYIHCAGLLALGEENSDALLDVFSFFYRCSVALEDLLSRAELFAVSQAIKDQVVLALADLVTLVVGVASHFHKSLGNLTSGCVAIDVHSEFAGPIESFRARCEYVAELMWTHQLSSEGLGNDVTVKAIREWLEPEDPILTRVTGFTAQFAQDREESTCLWVTPYLTRFLHGDQRTLAITGKAGAGKSILATVINDQLQHPIGGVSYAPVFVPINGRVPALTTPSAIAKSILSQLFASRIGNITLYRTLANTYQQCQKTVDEEKYVDLLWDTLRSSLQATLEGAKETVFIIDGADESSCGQPALMKRLNSATANANNLRLIVLGSEGALAGVAGTVSVHITPQLIFDDIAAVVRRVFSSAAAFSKLTSLEQETLVNRLVKAADCSFLWAKLAAKRLRDDSSSNTQGLLKALDTLLQASPNVNDLVSHNVRAAVDQTGISIIGWLAASPRPLTVREVSALLSVDLGKGAIVQTNVEPLATLKPLAPLVFHQNNTVCLRHARIRTAVLDVLAPDQGPKNKKKAPLVDLICRMALYIKHTVTGQEEPLLDMLDPHRTSSLLDRHPLLNFALRYWLGSMTIAFGWRTDGEIAAASKEIISFFPTCPLVPLLEMTVWKKKATPALALLHDVQTRLYRQILGSKHNATVQAVLCRALFYQSIEDVLPSQASQIFYDAATTCQQVLTAQHLITMQLTQHFLEFTSNQITASKTEMMKKRVTMLRLLVECYKVHYSTNSETVVSTLHELAQHYSYIEETQLAQEITSMLQKPSDKSDTTGPDRGPSEESLVVQLYGHHEVEEHGTVLVLDSVEEDEAVSASFDYDALLVKAKQAVREGHLTLAEQLFVDLWHRVSREYRLQKSVEWELRSLHVIRAFSEYLLSHKRESDVSSILSGFWEEHQHFMSQHEEVAAEFVAIAKLMKDVHLSGLSLEVLNQCAQAVSQHSQFYKEILEHRQAAFHEVMQSSQFSKVSVAESTIVEMLSTGSVSQAAAAQATDTLVQMYLAQSRWKEATRALKQKLQRVWPSFFAHSVEDVTLPAKHTQSCIKLALQLRDCYRYRRRPGKEEDLCFRLYRALRRDRPVDDPAFRSVTLQLMQLYERTRQANKLISIHREVLILYTKRFGEGHPMVLRELWTLAELTRPGAASVQYYRRIFELVNKGSDICKPSAFEPLLAVVTGLTSQGHHTEAVGLCRILFNTLQNPQTNPKLRDPEFVKWVYERYILCLQVTSAEYNVIHDVTVQYRKHCLAVFGAKASITIQATQTLAYICLDSAQHQKEAVELFKLLLDSHSDEVTIDHDDIRAIIDGIRKEESTMVSLSDMSSETIHRIITTHTQHLSSTREEYGWAHASSLSHMEQLVSLYHQNRETQTAVNLIQETALHIISSETSSLRLIATARTIVSSYRSVGQVHRARELALEIYQQIVAKDTTNVSSVGFDLTSSQRQSLIFLAQMEYNLREQESSLTFNETYSALMAEYLYFERFRTEIRSNSSTFQGIIGTVCHLQGLLLARNHSSAASRLIEQFTDWFIGREGQQLQVNHSQARILLSTVVEHFQTHSSQNLVRSIALASYNRVTRLLASKGSRRLACDLAQAAFRYTQAHDGFSHPPTMKLLFKTGLGIASYATVASPTKAQSQSADKQPQEQELMPLLLQTSATIIEALLAHCKTKNISLSQLDATNLNTLINLLDNQRSYSNLEWLLTGLWNQRQKAPSTQPDGAYTLALGRMLVITRYLVGEYSAAIRLAEDIVYNCVRVHGPRHASTEEMTILLSQMYASVAKGYQKQPGEHLDLAAQYYRKAAAVHENALRVFVDPPTAAPSGTIDISEADADPARLTPPTLAPSSPGADGSGDADPAKYVRQHLHLLKLAVERLGSWPRDYSEYENLNSDLFRVFGDDLKGITGVDKWNLKQFGAGRAEASDDLIEAKSLRPAELGLVPIAV